MTPPASSQAQIARYEHTWRRGAIFSAATLATPFTSPYRLVSSLARLALTAAGPFRDCLSPSLSSLIPHRQPLVAIKGFTQIRLAAVSS